MGPHLKHISLPAVTQTAAWFGGEREGRQSACGEGSGSPEVISGLQTGLVSFSAVTVSVPQLHHNYHTYHTIHAVFIKSLNSQEEVF